MKNTSVYISTIALLGLFTGGNIIIWFIVLPFWQSLPANELMQWFHNYGPRVGITMLPMQIIPLVLSIWAYNLVRKKDIEGKGLWLWVNVSNVTILIMFLVYYLPVNLQFVNQTMNPNVVSSELVRWEIIHIARTILAVLSTVLAIIAYFKLVRNFIYINMKPSHTL